ncbi:uncharacterized protein LOC104414092 [Eucalyptus grandis]|uniref:uncharacterized protein LOC104414092 n=1 Tax=Eucalyptus grandis TaxID=71139 RepID=UPI00192EB0E4|nr:uncharacterized protein LOC104414092 [Eucalyptus grandis]
MHARCNSVGSVRPHRQCETNSSDTTALSTLTYIYDLSSLSQRRSKIIASSVAVLRKSRAPSNSSSSSRYFLFQERWTPSTVTLTLLKDTTKVLRSWLLRSMHLLHRPGERQGFSKDVLRLSVAVA